MCISSRPHQRTPRQANQISDKEFFVIRELTGTSTDVIKKNEKSEPGLRNIDDAELAENQYLHFVGSLFAIPQWQHRTASDLFPIFWQIVVFTFKIATREIMSKNPVDMFQNPVYGYNVNKDFGLLILKRPPS